MKQLTICAVVAAITSFAPTEAAQQSTTAPKRDKAAKPASVTLKGCVAEASGHYLLNRATVVETPAAAAPRATAGQSDDQVYELIGVAVKPHVGHEVEITGTDMPSDNATPGGAAPSDLKRTAHPMAGTVTVKSVKMLSGTCP
jgi:hypothetical protein